MMHHVEHVMIIFAIFHDVSVISGTIFPGASVRTSRIFPTDGFTSQLLDTITPKGNIFTNDKEIAKI